MAKDKGKKIDLYKVAHELQVALNIETPPETNWPDKKLDEYILSAAKTIIFSDDTGKFSKDVKDTFKRLKFDLEAHLETLREEEKGTEGQIPPEEEGKKTEKEITKPVVKEKGKPKGKVNKAQEEKTELGSFLGTQAAAIDLAIIEGLSGIDVIAKKANVKTARVKAHIKHLQGKGLLDSQGKISL